MRHQVLAGLILCVIATGGNAATFSPLGDLPGGDFFSDAYGVSADGSVAGSSRGEPTESGIAGEAFRWTQSDGMVGLGGIPGASYVYTQAHGVSDDGTAIVGWGHGPLRAEAFRWTSDSGIVGLGTLSGVTTFAYDVSADGEVVVGDGGGEAFYWTNSTGMVGIGRLAETGSSAANGVSDDGQTIVGYHAFNDGITEPFRWTSTDGMLGLGYLPDTTHGVAMDVSADGRVVVGFAHGVYPRHEAFRWTIDGGMEGLGFLPGGFPQSEAHGVSANGSVIVGEAGGAPFVWTADGGMQGLLDLLVARGASGLNGWTLENVRAVSADGQWVVGRGRNPLGQDEAFLANITPVPLPATAPLFFVAAALLAPWVRRRVAFFRR